MKLKLEAWLNKSIQYVRSNTFGTTVNLSLNVAYTCPCDGYVQCSCGATANANAAAQVLDSQGSYFRIGGYGNGTYGTWTTFVRKGMIIKPTVIGNSGAVQFIPFV